MQDFLPHSPADNPLIVDLAQNANALADSYKQPAIWGQTLNQRSQVIVGATGAGKTSLMMMVARETSPMVIRCAATLTMTGVNLLQIEQVLLKSLAEATWHLLRDEDGWRALTRAGLYTRRLLHTFFVEQFDQQFEARIDRDLIQPEQREAVLGVQPYKDLRTQLEDPGRLVSEVARVCLHSLGRAAEGQVVFMLDVPSQLTLSPGQARALEQLVQSHTALNVVIKLFVSQHHAAQLEAQPGHLQVSLLRWTPEALTDLVNRQLVRLRNSATTSAFSRIPQSLDALIGRANLDVLQTTSEDHPHYFLAPTPVEWLYLTHSALQMYQERPPGNGAALSQESWIEARRRYIAQRLKLRIASNEIRRGNKSIHLTRTEKKLLLKMVGYNSPQATILAKTLADQEGLDRHSVEERIASHLLPKLEPLCRKNVPAFEREWFQPPHRYRGCVYLKRASNEGYYLENTEIIDPDFTVG